MKIVDISFYFGIVVVILTFITMVCFVWEDIHRQKEKITQNIGKYGVFICMWLLLAFFGLIFVLSYGTNILSLMGETAIYDTKGKIGIVIFMLWAVFIAVRYYLYVLFSEFTSDNKNDVIKKEIDKLNQKKVRLDPDNNSKEYTIELVKKLDCAEKNNTLFFTNIKNIGFAFLYDLLSREAKRDMIHRLISVSYTHLTLPTIA